MDQDQKPQDNPALGEPVVPCYDPKSQQMRMIQYADQLAAKHGREKANIITSFAYMCQMTAESVPESLEDSPVVVEMVSVHFKNVGSALGVHPVEVAHMIEANHSDSETMTLRSRLRGDPH
jgi:hypothetical protein